MSAHLHPTAFAPAALLPIGVADVPIAEIGDARYAVRFAQTSEELDAVLRLRFEVFNLELGEGLSESFATGRDEDAFDAVCRHLMVVERTTGVVVGTYRLQTSAMAAAGRGFYTATEYDLGGVPREVLDDAVELGRACISREHRNTRVLFLLWKGLAAYVAHNDKRYLFGCCSLTTQDPKEGSRVAEWLEKNGHVETSFALTPRKGFECGEAEDNRAEAQRRDASRDQSGTAAAVVGAAEIESTPVRVPPLFGIYLRYGAKVCGAPALDRAFGTVDFPVMLDVHALSATARAAFFGAEGESKR